MRLTSEFWVSALCRKAAAEGAFVFVAHKGAQDAGAIFVVLNNLAGAFWLYGPAPQSVLAEGDDNKRVFECLVSAASELVVAEKLEREKRFDPDIWIVEIEDTQARDFTGLVESAPD